MTSVNHGLLYRLTCDCNGGGADIADPTTAYWTWVQRRLAAHGFDPGPIDGVRGPRTDSAIVGFKVARGLREREYIGPVTEGELASAPRGSAPVAGPAPGEIQPPPWLPIARSYLGLREIPGGRHNPQIVEWWQMIDAGWFDDDETPWCGGFVGGVLVEAGIEILPGSEAPRARAWENWGREVDFAVGAVVTLWRGSRTSGSGHVFFLLGRGQRGDLVGIGGNQTNAVTIARFDRDRMTSVRWPGDYPLPAVSGWNRLPVYGGDNQIVRSIDEA